MALWEFWQTDRPRTRAQHAAFHRPREAIFAVGAAGNLCEQPEHATLNGGIIGSNTAGPHAASHDVYDATIPYLKNRTGGYGAQYAGTIAATGLTVLAAPEAGLPCDAPTALGERVAEAFRGRVAGTRYVRNYFDDDRAQVPADVVREYINRACLCQLRTDSAPERDLLRHAFLHGGTAQEADAQRATFRFMLDLAEQTDGHALDEDQFRQLAYFRETDQGVAYAPVEVAARTARRWRMYQAREYYNFALNRIWQWVVAHGLEVTNEGLRSLPVEELVATARSSLDGEIVLAPGMGRPALTAATPLRAWVSWAAQKSGAEHAGLDGTWDVDGGLHEHRLLKWMEELEQHDPRALPAALLTLTLIACRFGSRETEMRHRDDWDLMVHGGQRRLAMSLFFSRWRGFLDSGALAGDVLAWLLEHYVIRQHLRVANSKLPQNDTFRFMREGAHLRFHDLGAHITMNNSRFNSITTVLYELGLMGQVTTANHAPTSAGQRLLEVGDLPEPHAAGAAP